MNYILKQYNIELMKFSMDSTNDGLQVEKYWRKQMLKVTYK